MASPGSFTNVRTLREGVEESRRSRLVGAYVARGEGGKVMPLTEREREARRQARIVNGSATLADQTRPITGVNFSFNKEANVPYTPSGMGGNTLQSGTSNFFDPQLSTDFLELPQSLREKREKFRHFYSADPIVGQAIDLHTELPLSKIRLAPPKPTTCPAGFEDPHEYGKYILTFFEKMCKRIKLFQRLITIVHEYWLQGSAFPFAEDSDVQIPPDIGYERKVADSDVIQPDGSVIEAGQEYWVERSDREEQELAYYQKNYRGWDKLIVLPIDQIRITSYSFTDKSRIELIPSEKDRALIEQARFGNDPVAEEMVNEIPSEVREYIEQGKLIPMGTDPDEGSFVYHLAGRRGAKDELGQSILDRVLRTLYLKEKLRQAQTQIASRAMTPKRIVWAEDISEQDVEELREQVDLSLVDPDYSIVTNYEVHWEEMGSKDRLLDLQSEYDQANKDIMTGLGVTEGLMSGESLYSGDRLKLEVINTRYLFLRELIQEFVEEYIFKPVARRKGFIEKDKWGEEVVLSPRLSFTRLPLRDSQDTYDALFNLYQKGSLPIDIILDMFNIDADDAAERIRKDLFTVNDVVFNEVIRGMYGDMGGKLVEGTDILQKVADYLKLKMKPPEKEPEEGRF